MSYYGQPPPGQNPVYPSLGQGGPGYPSGPPQPGAQQPQYGGYPAQPGKDLIFRITLLALFDLTHFLQIQLELQSLTSHSVCF